MANTMLRIPARWRTLLVLGRVSNLPTVWSNCLAGWYLGGGETLGALLWVSLGTSLLYLGGMFLNDFCDVEFDRIHRPERPLPAGEIAAPRVGQLSLLLLATGAVVTVLLAGAHLPLTGALVVLIFAYNALHKRFAHAPLLIALCRFLLYLLAASTAVEGITGLALWSALALGAYVVGLGYLARAEYHPTRLRWWPTLLLLAPVLLAYLANGEAYLARVRYLLLIFAVWCLASLGYVLKPARRSPAQAVSGLLAGIVLVDLLAVAGGSEMVAAVFGLLFLLAVGLQRQVAAT